MSTRYEDTRDRDDVGRGVRRDVRDSGRNIREAGGDIISNWCGLWSNLLSGVSEAIAPRTRSSRSSSVADDDENSQGLFFCDGGEFRISCNRATTTERDEEQQGGPSRRRRNVTAKYSDRDRGVDVRADSRYSV